ncbi:flagella accessory C family protein, partial [Halorubrum sp. SD626R]|uniref:FlaD/FlaE family flagellar protein n=1 Tax=Halorubrum sp. SD626R TaxID=1419722 RepID=UPI001134FDA0
PGESADDEVDPFDDADDGFDDADDGFDDADDGFDDADDDFGAGDGFDEEASDADPFADEPAEPEPEPEPSSHAEPEPDRSRGPRPGGDPAEASGDGFEYVGTDDLSGGRGKPYLTELPGDYVGDLLVMEWLEFLVSESDVTDAVRAINYYERIEWVGPEAAARLRDFLSGFGTIDRNVVDRPGTDRLVREHHTRSLRYVTQLNGTSGHLMPLDRWDDLAGGSLVGGGAPSINGRSGRGGSRGHPDRRGSDRRGDGRRRDGEDRRDANGRRENGHDPDADARTNRSAHREGGDGRRDERSDRRTERASERDRNGGSPRPMNDPNPRSDRADPADGGWGDGR